MTFLPLHELERRRAEGASPKGGPAPDFSETSLSLTLSPRDKLDALLNLQWDHPMDEALMGSIQGIVGDHSRARILTAAEYVRERGAQPRGVAVSAYNDLIAGLTQS